jgi:hypothetical protein
MLQLLYNRIVKTTTLGYCLIRELGYYILGGCKSACAGAV